jgi:TRAP-type C4-dicarboxylate transport system permease small subunit
MDMNKKPVWYRIGSGLLNFTEIYLPVAIFSCLFVVFMLQVFFRYFRAPLIWPEEFSNLAYIWTILLGSCYALRDDSHVKFSLVYDQVGPTWQCVMRVIGNLLLFAAFGLAVYPSYKFIVFMGFKKSDALRIPMNLAFSPFLVFLVLILGRLVYKVLVDLNLLVRTLKRRGESKRP